MRTSQGSAWRPLVAALVGSIAVAAAAQSWTFDGDAQGWQARDLTSYTEIGDASDVVWNETGGASGGYISKFDPSVRSYFLEAPIAAGSDYSSFVGGSLAFSLRSDFNDWVNDNVVIFRGVTGGVSTTIVTTVPVPDPTGVWLSYTVDLDAANFHVGSRDGSAPSAVQFTEIMGSLSTFLLPGEFGNGVKETTGIDSVRFTAIPEPSTYAALVGGAALSLVAIRRYRRR